MSVLTVDPIVAHQLSPHLDIGEKLVWAERPRQGIRFRSSDLFQIPFSLAWCGFAIFWVSGAISSGAPLFFVLFGSIFVAVGLYIVFGRFIYESLVRARTGYGITDRRVLVSTGLFSTRLRSFALNGLNDTKLTLERDGSGTIELVASNSVRKLVRFSSSAGLSDRELYGIADASAVHRVIREQASRRTIDGTRQPRT